MNATARTLTTILDNQLSRTRHAIGGTPDEFFHAQPGGGCNSIANICGHLVRLHAFQMMLIGSPLADETPSKEGVKDASDAVERLMASGALLRRAIEEASEADWHVVLDPPPLPEKWVGETQLERMCKPFNDYVNHLGGIRAIRRIMGSPVETTQD